VLVAGGSLAARAAGVADAAVAGATLNWETWGDHYSAAQLKYVKKMTGIGVRPTLFSDDSAGYTKLRAVRNQFDMQSADAYWVGKYYSSHLVDPFDIHSLPVSKELYSLSTELSFWKAGSGYLAYPNGWSANLLFYNPKYVKPKPTSWDVLIDPRYKRKIVLQNQPTEVGALAGLATGAKHPYNMTSAELSRAKAWMKQLKPNVLKFTSQSVEDVNALADESAWFDYNSIGTEQRVKLARGPLVKSATPKEGVTGWVDGEMLVHGSKNRAAALTFLNTAERARWVAQNFLTNAHPYLNEKAYKLLVNTGHKELVDTFQYNDPERIHTMTIAGPSGNAQAYTDAFNEAFAP
jgi:spermidine/putrescine transport system substrate-binding protein